MSSTKKKRDYYEVLGINREANQDEIKRAFRKGAMKWHPDRNKAPEATDKFAEINEAYQILSDEQKRSQYDRFGFDAPEFGQGFSGSGFSSFSDIMDMFFGEGFGGGFGGMGGSGSRRRRQVRGEDIEKWVTLTFKEAVFGVKKEITYTQEQPCHQCDGLGAASPSDIKTCTTCGGKGQVTRTTRTILGLMQQVGDCPKCGGSGKEIKRRCPVCKGNKVIRAEEKTSVSIPPGVDNEMHLKVPGHGNIPTKDAIPGDLYVGIRVQNDSRFVRDGYNILSEIECDFAKAIVGCEATVETVDGPATIKIKPGTQPETHLRLKNKGIPTLESRGKQRGHHIVTIKVTIPKITDLSKKQKDLVEQYLKTLA